MTTRNILRFPTGKQFARILADDHEWEVLTDLGLHPLVMVRGEQKGSISLAETKRAYYQLHLKVPLGKEQIRIYDLHTHPKSPKATPSTVDMKQFLEESILKPYGVIIVGHGVITKHEIGIIKIHGSVEARKKLYWEFPDEYRERALTRMMDTKDTATQSHSHALKGMLKENPEIKLKKVRKTHRFNMKVRR